MGEIFMPKMGDAMTEGKVVRWYKKAGDPVKKGDPVLEIETDKVNLDLEAEEDGVLDEIKVEAGSVAEVGTTLATTRAEGVAPSAKSEKKSAPAAEKTKKLDDARSTAEEKHTGGEAKPVETAKPSAPAAVAVPPKEGERVRSSPLARKMAHEMSVDLFSVHGSGPQGRVIAADITAAAKERPAGGPAAPPKPAQQLRPAAPLEEKEIPLSAMRKTIAKRLVESIGPVPHFFLTVDLDVTNLLIMRTQLNDIEGAKVSVNDFVVRAAALALRHHAYVNASFTETAIKQHGTIDVGIAVSTPEGLITPVVRNADRKSLVDISNEVRNLADRARNRRLKPDEYQGSTFTISNLGMYGIDEFTAIINPPNSAILAVGTASPQPTVVERRIVVRDRMKITMSCDHRVVDGAAGAEYLKTLRQYIEQPLRLVM